MLLEKNKQHLKSRYQWQYIGSDIVTGLPYDYMIIDTYLDICVGKYNRALTLKYELRELNKLHKLKMTELSQKSMLELLELKEYYREKYGLYIENEMGERGSMNYKTKPYWCCDFKKRINDPEKKGVKYNACRSYQTFNSYKEALIFCLEIADDVNKDMV